jgi:hypothetical protein
LWYYHDYSTDCLHRLIFIHAYLPSITRLLVGEVLSVIRQHGQDHANLDYGGVGRPANVHGGL